MGLGKTYSTKYLVDSNGNTGAANQVLVSTATGVDWVDGSGSGIIGGPYLPLSAGASYPLTGDLYLATASNQGSLFFGTADASYKIFGGGTYGYMGYNTGGYHRFLLSGTEKMRITSTGNVGIGTTSPTNYKLQVNGTVESSAFSVEGASARIFAPSGANYNGSGTQTGYLIAKLPDNAGSGINNMMTGVIRVYDYTSNESFDVHFAGYWYSGYNWNNCSAWIDSAAYADRNFSVRFGKMDGVGTGTRPYIMIGEATSTWTYCKFSVINYEPGHSNYEAYKWDKGWNMDINATNPGTVLVIASNTQTNNWVRNGQDLYYGSGTGNVGIGTTRPDAQLEISNNNATSGVGGATLRLTREDGTSVAGDPVGTIEFYSTDMDGPKTTAYIKSMSEELYGRKGSLAFGTSVTVNTDAVEAMRIDYNGNVGIGTDSPGYKLDVDGGNGIFVGDGGVAVLSANSTTGIFTIGDTDQLGDGVYATNTSTSSFDIYSTGSIKFRMDVNGNVGIGTDSPGAKLDVNGATYVRGVIYGYAGSGFQYGGLSWNGTDSGFLFAKSGNVTDVLLNSNGDSYLNGGNVGIGVTSPTYKLDVSGNIRVTGTGTFTSTVTATNFILSSDERIKENIKDFDYNQHIDLDVKTYELKSEPGVKRTGVIAQELEVNHPEFVRTDKEGMKSVSYIDLLVAKNAELEARVLRLEKLINEKLDI